MIANSNHDATAQPAPVFDARRALALARDTLRIEADALLGLLRHLGQETDTPPDGAPSAGENDFARATAMLLACRGRVVVSGIGKSGHIARKVAATLASTGTPAFFLHPAEASHGDLGMVTTHDVFIAFSNSGEVEELTTIVPLIKRLGAGLIAVTGNPNSTLGQLADAILNCRVEKEACPLNLAPTASTAAQMALGDALAVAVLDARGFNSEDFARSHPGGALGRRLLTYVRDIMRTGEAIPRTQLHASLSDALLEIARKRMGMTAIVDENDKVVGIFTDGDLSRLLSGTQDFRQLRVTEVMTHHPRTLGPDHLAAEAVELMERHRINQLVVTDTSGKLIGALNMHDLLAAKIL